MLSMQQLVCLACRYRHEVSSRRKFLVDRRAAQLHADLERLLGSMVPPRFSRRAALEECVVEPYDHATVLFCTFSSTQARPHSAPCLPATLPTAVVEACFFKDRIHACTCTRVYTYS